MADRLCRTCDDLGVVRNPDGFKPCPDCYQLCDTGCTADRLCSRHADKAQHVVWTGGAWEWPLAVPPWRRSG